MFLSNSRVYNSCARAHFAQVKAFTYNSAKERCQQINKNEFRNRKSKSKKECDHITIEALFMKKAYICKVTIA